MNTFLLLCVPVAACFGAHAAARRKGQQSAWAFAAFCFPPSLLLLELTPTRAGIRRKTSSLVLEWIACLWVLAQTALAALNYTAQP